MVTLHTHIDGRNKEEMSFTGLSTDTKPIEKWHSTEIENSATFFEMDTGKVFMYDLANKKWLAL